MAGVVYTVNGDEFTTGNNSPYDEKQQTNEAREERRTSLFKQSDLIRRSTQIKAKYYAPKKNWDIHKCDPSATTIFCPFMEEETNMKALLLKYESDKDSKNTGKRYKIWVAIFKAYFGQTNTEYFTTNMLAKIMDEMYPELNYYKNPSSLFTDAGVSLMGPDGLGLLTRIEPIKGAKKQGGLVRFRFTDELRMLTPGMVDSLTGDLLAYHKQKKNPRTLIQDIRNDFAMIHTDPDTPMPYEEGGGIEVQESSPPDQQLEKQTDLSGKSDITLDVGGAALCISVEATVMPSGERSMKINFKF